MQAEIRVKRRLRPYYISIFFDSFVLWYSVDKPFMKLIGMTNTQIGIAISSVAAVILLTEIPSGIISDKWSRKGTQQVAVFFKFLCPVVAYFSNSFLTYTIAICLWGVYMALASGVGQSLIYDTLIEEKANTDNYEKYFGRREIITSAGLIGGSLASSLVVFLTDSIRLTYLLSAPFMLIGLFILHFYKEPKLHKVNQASTISKLTVQTFSELFKQPQIYLLIGIMVLASSTETVLIEFSQVWWIAFGVPLVWFGPIHAISQASLGAGGALASIIKGNNVVYFTILITLSSLMLTTSITYLVAPALFLVLSITLALNIILAKRLNDHLTSQVRTGAISIVSFLSSLFVIVFSIIFGYLTDRYTIFNASWLIVFFMVLVSIGIIFEYRTPKKLAKQLL